MSFDIGFFRGRKILITGHTGFKGAWMCRLLINAGAGVTGYALEPPTEPSLFELCGLSSEMNSLTGDIRDLEYLKKAFAENRPEIVIHMAAQPIVRDSYKEPVYTYETNVMGTVNVMEAVRCTSSVRSVVNVTTDKVYKNREWEWGYRENEELNGFDPYSNSKSCSELVTDSYKNSFFGGNTGLRNDGGEIAVSTCRAGNVIGGGDFSNDRIIPDCVRAVQNGQKIVVRNPASVRPYQHVLEPVAAYLMVAQAQYNDISYAGNYNIGPEISDCRSTKELVSLFCEKWNETISGTGLHPAKWRVQTDPNAPHEANFLKLDCSKIKGTFGWLPRWTADKAIGKTVEWTKAYLLEESVSEVMDLQIGEYLQSIQAVD